MRFVSVFAFFLFISSKVDFITSDSLFGEALAIRLIRNPELTEISGMAFGKQNPGMIYLQTDSGGEPAVYVMDSMGVEHGKIMLIGAKNRDWEDIAVGPGLDQKSYIYIADIGDNRAKRENITIYRIPEPTLILPEAKVLVEKISLKYPRGPRDAETLLVDPISADLYIISKRDDQNTIFWLSALDFEKGKGVLTDCGKLPFTSSTGGDISQDGCQILIKNYESVFYWNRNPHESVFETLMHRPVKLPYAPEPQGEAIAFISSGKAYYTTSEMRKGKFPVLYRYSAVD